MQHRLQQLYPLVVAVKSNEGYLSRIARFGKFEWLQIIIDFVFGTFRDFGGESDFDFGTNTLFTPDINLAVDAVGLKDAIDDSQSETRPSLEGVLL